MPYIIILKVRKFYQSTRNRFGTAGKKPMGLRLRGIMIGYHFHANMKVQTAMCKDNNNSKRRAATYVKFDKYMK